MDVTINRLEIIYTSFQISELFLLLEKKTRKKDGTLIFGELKFLKRLEYLKQDLSNKR
jgi:hypothetical protein